MSRCNSSVPPVVLWASSGHGPVFSCAIVTLPSPASGFAISLSSSFCRSPSTSLQGKSAVRHTSAAFSPDSSSACSSRQNLSLPSASPFRFAKREDHLPRCSRAKFVTWHSLPLPLPPNFTLIRIHIRPRCPMPLPRFPTSHLSLSSLSLRFNTSAPLTNHFSPSPPTLLPTLHHSNTPALQHLALPRHITRCHLALE